MKKNFKRNKGFTLIELLVVISILGIVIAAAFNMFSFTNKAQRMTTTEYDIQSQVRVISQTLNNNIRFTSALFALPEITNPNSIRGWNYITTTNIDGEGYGDEIIDYVYDDSDTNNPKWIERVIVESKPNIKYKLEFYKENDYDVDKLIQFYISIKDESSGAERSLKTEVEALNSLQIIDRGRTLGEKSKIICYRMDDRPLSAEAAVTMVLDKSGSMDADLNGNNTGNNSRKRITMLKNKSKDLIDSFAEKHNIFMNIVPFSSSANNPRDYNNSREGYSYIANAYDDFLNVSTDAHKLKADIDKLQALGGTNTGDGIRRGYYNLDKYYNDNISRDPDTEIKNYMIVLVDGVSTFYTVHGKNDRRNLLDNTAKIDSRYLDRGGWTYNSYQVAGNGGNLDAGAEAYIQAIGNKVKNAATIGGIKSYVIGFSNLAADHGSLGNIGDALNAEKSPDGNKFFKATSDAELETVFNNIKDDITRDLWHVYGPH